MIERAADGITVAGVFEESQYHSNTGTEYDNLLAAGLDVRLDGNPRSMHHKVFIIDNKTVITGSYNPSKNANERNDENVLIIHDEDIAGKYLDEFNRLYLVEDGVPDETSDLVISEILYDAQGSDEGNEYVLLRNIGENVIHLDYYFLI